MSDVSPSRPESEGPVTGEDPPTSPTARGPLLPPAPPPDSLSELDSESSAAAAEQVAEPELTELEVALMERDEWMDRAQRIAAEYENYRRRLATQRADDIDRATGRLAEALLPVLDACEAHYEKKRAEGTLVSTVRGVRLEINLEELNLP